MGFVSVSAENMVICIEDQDTGECSKKNTNGELNHPGRMYANATLCRLFVQTGFYEPNLSNCNVICLTCFCEY